METVKTSLTLKKETKEAAQKLFEEMGLSFSGAIELFLTAVVREKGIPFAITTKPMQSGYVYGVVQLSDDEGDEENGEDDEG